MATANAPQSEPPVPFSYSIDTEILSIVLEKELYLIPFQNALAAFDAIRRRMIQTKAFRTVLYHRNASGAAINPPTASQLLKHYQYLIVNHPSREVPPSEESFPKAQFRKRSRLLDQIFSKIIGTIYVRGVGRPPRKYTFDDRLDLMLLEQVLQRNAHLQSRSALSATFSIIRQAVIHNYGFTSGHTVPAPTNVIEGAPTASQLIVRYQFLILSHVSARPKEEPGQVRVPESTRKSRHLLDIIVRDIVTQALSGPQALRRARRSSLEALENDGEPPAPRPKRRKSYPSDRVPIVEQTPRIRGIPAANVLDSKPILAREVDKTIKALTAVDKKNESRAVPLAAPEDEVVWRKRMEERRMALDEDQQKNSWKLASLQEQRMKIEQQRMKLQEKTFEMMQEEHKLFLRTLSDIATTFSQVAEKLGFVPPKTDSHKEDQVGADTIPQSCGPAPAETPIVRKEPIINDETPMDIASASKDVPPGIEGQPAKKKLAAEAKQPKKCEAPGEGQANKRSESAVENEQAMSNGPSKEVSEGKEEPENNTVGRAKKLGREVAPKQAAVGKVATAKAATAPRPSGQ